MRHELAERFVVRGGPAGSRRLEAVVAGPTYRGTLQPGAHAMPTMTTGYELLQRAGNAARFHLVESAISLHPWGPALHDDEWHSSAAAESGTLRMHNTSTQHFKDIQPSDVLSVEPDPHAPRDGLVHLRVRLARRLWMRGADAGWVPRGRRLRPIPRRPR